MSETNKKTPQKPNRVTRAIIDATVERCMKEIDEDPKRSIRKMTDLGRLFSRGRLLDEIYRMIQDLLRNDDSPYYVAIERLLRNTNRENMKQYGINFGYNGITFGGKVIRDHEEQKGIRIPWAIVLRYNPESNNAITLNEIEAIITQGRMLGIYCYMIRCTGTINASELLELCNNFKDCSFTIFHHDQHFHTEDITLMKTATHVMHMFSADGGHSLNNVTVLKKNKILFGIYDEYDDNDAEAWVSGEKLHKLEPFQGVFTIIIAKDDCSFKNQEKVGQYCRKYRLHPEHPYILFDLIGDIQQIGHLISAEDNYFEFMENGDIRTRDDFISDFRHTVSLEQLFTIAFQH